MNFLFYGKESTTFLQHRKCMTALVLQWYFSQYIYQDSKLLAPVVCFTELVETGLFAVWAEQHSASFTLFLTRTAWKESIVPKLNIG